MDQAPFVGRRREVARLDTLLSEPKGRMVLVSGEPGIGKTRLVHQAIATARRRGDLVLDGTLVRCPRGDGGSVAAHASLVAREHGIPAVVGTRDATRRLCDGQIVTVDGSAGVVEL